MKNTLVKLTSDKPACAGFDDEYLYISFQVDHETFDALKNAANGNKSGRNGYTVVQLESIEEIICYQKAEDFFFWSGSARKRKKYGLQISNGESRTAFCKDLAKACGLKTKIETNDPYSRVGRNAIPIIMIGLLTVGCCLGASEKLIEAKSAKSRAISDAFKAIGPTAFLIIGLSFIGFFLFRLIKNIKASDIKIVYSF